MTNSEYDSQSSIQAAGRVLELRSELSSFVRDAQYRLDTLDQQAANLIAQISDATLESMVDASVPYTLNRMLLDLQHDTERALTALFYIQRSVPALTVPSSLSTAASVESFMLKNTEMPVESTSSKQPALWPSRDPKERIGK